ncbi:hypothetical protein TRIUR3_30736 [Triticum urartu]|uniref:Uncharacterized protein n=1 Tax=Triticum urartu TaxID=4572 RepID=M7ZV06_TRIUA|nr:hypothetical protein TRIUR3_30736 [Triticum urartu]
MASGSPNLLKVVSIQRTHNICRERFIAESKDFQVNMLGGSIEDLPLLLKERDSLENESENLRMKINAIQSSSKEYIAEILEEVNVENSVRLRLDVDIQWLGIEFAQMPKIPRY